MAEMNGPSIALLRAPRRVRRVPSLPHVAVHTSGTLVNDVQAQLNPTRVRRSLCAQSVEALQAALAEARKRRLAVSVCGARHAMGAQQFGTDTLLLDLSGMDRILAFDPIVGQVEVEAGIRWPHLIAALLERQHGGWPQWSIRQKQSGADDLSLGGALAANIHGRGLSLKPIIGDVEAFTLLDAEGRLIRASRLEHPELFRLAIGGYGLFGIVTSVRLRLMRRRKLERLVRLLRVEELIGAFEQRIREGFLYGDFQFAIDRSSDAFLRDGILSCYRPVEDARPIPLPQHALNATQWEELAYLAHANPREAFERYAAHYLATSGQLYWSDWHQMSTYVPRYHEAVSRRLSEAMDPLPQLDPIRPRSNGAGGDPPWYGVRATEVITELYVPRPALAHFLSEVRRDFRRHGVPLIYGTIRLIERDDESFLAWAKQPYACVIFNLHTIHTPAGLARTASDFRRLIDLAIGSGGSFYLTYHRFATREQVVRCYPQFPGFLQLKRRYDPQERFQSDWYRHYRSLFAG